MPIVAEAVYMWGQGFIGTLVPSIQFFCDPKTAKSSLFLKKVNVRRVLSSDTILSS